MKKKSVKALTAKMRKIISWKSSLEKMEEMLIVWIQDKVQKNIPIRTAAIREKALYFHDYVNQQSENSSTN